MPILDRETTVYPDNLLADLAERDTTRKWWAVYTKARQEKAFVRQLEGMDVPFYLPLIPKDNLIRGRRVRSHIPLFTGYVFLFGTDEERVKGLTTNRVSTVIDVKDPQQLVTDLRSIATLIESEARLTIESRLEPGDPVRIKTGSMAGLEGTVVHRRGKTRLLVAVNMLQQGVSIEIEDFQVEPI
ncbi:MAG: transcription termination/antitermination NusG family protein [Pirellulaceae bacterium]